MFSREKEGVFASGSAQSERSNLSRGRIKYTLYIMPRGILVPESSEPHLLFTSPQFFLCAPFLELSLKVWLKVGLLDRI